MRIFYRLLIAAFLVAALPGPAAQALDGKEVADKLITVVVIGGATVAGLPPPSPEQVTFMKEMVGCIIDGASVVDCGKQSVIKAVLKEVPAVGQKFAECALSGRNVGGCATDELLKQVPEQARPLVKCVFEGNDVAGCGTQFAAGIVDQQTKQATQQALDALNKMKTGEGLPDAMKNILEGAEGIREGDFGKIAHGFGTEAAKLVITIVVEAILGPEVAPIAGPIISEIVQNRTDLIRDLMEGLKEVDPVKLGKILVEFYLTTYVEAACALIPDGGFKEATCGTVAKVISAVAGAAADVLGAVLGFLGDVGEAIIGGVVKFFDWLGDGIASIFSGDSKEDPKVCFAGSGSWQGYYANNFLTCLTTGADSSNVADKLMDACIANFNRCYDFNQAAQACGAMGGNFGSMVLQLSGDVTRAAEAYGNSAAAFAAANPLYACDADSWFSSSADSLGREFINNCASSIGKKMPWSKNKCPVAGHRDRRMWRRGARRCRAARHGMRVSRRSSNGSTASWKPCGRSASGPGTFRTRKTVASRRTTPPMAGPIK